MNSDLLRYKHINLHSKHSFVSCELPPSPGERNTDRSGEIKELHHKYHVTHNIHDLYRSRGSLYISVHTKLSVLSCHVERARWLLIILLRRFCAVFGKKPSESFYS